ncbi:MAG: cytochrome c biogenesis protein CcsA [Candidatus Omnitrophica bacterium]|nr:cytochrome c biogenesis protein CcsA [Candidatus Omnitrophota bacterium]
MNKLVISRVQMSLMGLFVLFNAVAFAIASDTFDVSAIRKLPVQYNGRVQPLESLAINLAETVHGRKSIDGLTALEFFFDLMSRPDVWYSRPVLKIGCLPLKRETGLDAGQNYFSMSELESSEGLQGMFAQLEAKSESGEDLLPLDRKTQSVRSALLMMNAVLTGDILRIGPPEPGPSEAWFSLRELAEHPSERNLSILVAVRKLMDFCANVNQAAFNEEAARLIASLKSAHPEIWADAWKWDLEIAYQSQEPFRISWIFYLLSGVLLITGWRVRGKWWNRAGIAAFAAAFVYHTIGLTLRILVLSRPPVSNMFESVVFMSWMVSVFALVLALILKRMLLINVSAFVGAAILILGSLMPFDPSLDVLVPVLRSNYWLTIHVLTIVSSYGAFALAMGIGHVALGHFIWASRAQSRIKDLTQLTYRSMQIGVILLAAGTILGGVWANESWGRFWGWDPKETWALISLLGYLALLHARHIGWIREFGLAVGSLLCFMLVVMTWYGVNFVLGRGLHSYGFGAGGGQWIVLYLILEILYLAVAAAKTKRGLLSRV